jgi:PHD/YefM family antitoxin component YafN of YafNO toxin-antitoxin module
MEIKPSAAIRKNYNQISELCKSTKEPVYLTKNGEGDLVVMDIATFSRRESMLKLREQLVAVEEDRLTGKKGYTIGELEEMLTKVIGDRVNKGFGA